MCTKSKTTESPGFIFSEQTDTADVASIDSNEQIEDLLGKAETLLKLGDYHNAIPIYNAVIAKDSSKILAYFKRGYCYAATNALQKSNSDFNVCAEHNFKLESSFLNLSVNYYQLGKTDSAKIYLSKVLEINADNQKASIMYQILYGQRLESP